MTDPEFIFKRVRNEGYMEPLFYFLLLFLIFSVLTLPATLINDFLLGTALQGMERLFFLVLIPFGILTGLLVAIAIVFGFAGIVHAFVTLYDGKAEFLNTFKAVIYGFTPSFTIGIVIVYLAFIPVLGILFLIPFIYNMVLMIIGLRSLNETTTGKAALSVIIPVLILAALFLLSVIVIIIRTGLF
jgi:hypothetical protein